MPSMLENYITKTSSFDTQATQFRQAIPAQIKYCHKSFHTDNHNIDFYDVSNFGARCRFEGKSPFPTS